MESAQLGNSVKKRILVIDDNRDARTLMTSILEALECDATAVGTGQGGVDAAVDALKQSNPYDLIITDIQMPDLSGTEVASQIRQAGHRGGIIVFTAMPTAFGKKAAKGAGIDAYFSKSVLNKDLMSAILAEFCS